MTMMDAPAYDPTHDRRMRTLGISALVLVVLTLALAFAGRMSGHGWFFTNIPAERKVDHFFKALEAKDYAKAYGIWVNDADWQQHPDKPSFNHYTLDRFTEDWTRYSPVKQAIYNHHVDVSNVDGTGFWGTGVIVGVTVNGSHKIFMYVIRADGTLEWPAPHELIY